MGLNPFTGCVACIGCSGIILLLVGGIGFPISKHQNNIFELTTCNVTEHLPLETKSCTWCDYYTEYYTCCSSCNCVDGRCQTCCRTCTRRVCRRVGYTCSAAVWELEYATDEPCTNPSQSTVRDDYQKSSGYSATEHSQNMALQRRNIRLVGSEYDCYYNSKKCEEIKWKISNPKTWRDVLISGGALGGFAVLVFLIFLCMEYDIGGVICSACSNACAAQQDEIQKVPQSPSAPAQDEIQNNPPPPFFGKEANPPPAYETDGGKGKAPPMYQSTNELFKKV